MFAQFTKLQANTAFQMKFDGPGRACSVKIGDMFLVTNPRHMQDKGIKIARAKKARLNEGYMLTIEQVKSLFSVVQ